MEKTEDIVKIMQKTEDIAHAHTNHQDSGSKIMQKTEDIVHPHTPVTNHHLL